MNLYKPYSQTVKMKERKKKKLHSTVLVTAFTLVEAKLETSKLIFKIVSSYWPSNQSPCICYSVSESYWLHPLGAHFQNIGKQNLLARRFTSTVLFSSCATLSSFSPCSFSFFFILLSKIFPYILT